MPTWKNIKKFSASIENTEGSPIGLLLLLTYADTIISTNDVWTEEKGVSTSYLDVAKPITSYPNIPKSQYIEDFLFQDGDEYVFQDGTNKVFGANTYLYSQMVKPSTIYSDILKPA